MSEPQSRKQSQEAAQAAERKQEWLDSLPYSLEEIHLALNLTREPGWKIFSKYRQAMRRSVEEGLHDLSALKSESFVRSHAYALGRHAAQQQYESFEDYFRQALDGLLEIRKEEP